MSVNAQFDLAYALTEMHKQQTGHNYETQRKDITIICPICFHLMEAWKRIEEEINAERRKDE